MLTRWRKRRPRAARRDLSGRVALVTGVKEGSLGEATAQALASWGARVIVTTRRDPAAAAARLRAATGRDRFEGLALDLTDRGSVDALTETLGARDEGLDLLINNAGIHLDLMSRWDAPQLTEDGFELHFRTNYLGTMQLTLGLVPALRRAAERRGEARIVTLVSMLHDRGRNEALFGELEPYDSWAAYGTSKLGLVHAMQTLDASLSEEGIRAVSLHPGEVSTNVADAGLETHPLLQRARRLLTPLERQFLMSPDEGAQTTLHCATTQELEGGAYYRRCAVAEMAPAARDEAARARLWHKTRSWVDGDVT